VSNPDNRGLVMPIDALAPLVDEYGSQGLSRTSMWMLSAVVAADVAESHVGLDFPFQWIGTKTCQELNNNNCGNDHAGNQASCTQSSAPNRQLCHGTSGTTTILEFFQREFNFNAQQVAAIMGAHSVGAMRSVNLGCAGWDLTIRLNWIMGTMLSWWARLILYNPPQHGLRLNRITGPCKEFQSAGSGILP
jgi:hypothetical protein